MKNPAIVLNPGTAGVGLVHALGLAGVPIITVGRTWPPLLGRFSRFPLRHVAYDPRRETLADCLRRIGGDFEGRGVLFPAIDVDLEAILLAQDALQARYHVPAAPHIGADILTKDWQYGLARPQRDDVFLVRDALVALNRLPVEQAVIAELARAKTRIGAAPWARDPLLSALHAAAIFAVRLTGRPLFS